jgi:hypothetical protein
MAQGAAGVEWVYAARLDAAGELCECWCDGYE